MLLVRSVTRVVIALLLSALSIGVWAFDLPPDFDNTQVIGGLREPDAMAFAPDGRMFIGERIVGELRVAELDNQTGQWTLLPQPFYTFDTPKNAQGQPEARRSAGLRGIAFDPDFATNGFVYVFYMPDSTLHNRVVRIKADSTNPNLADLVFGEELLIDLPFNTGNSSGSHNGGALVFGDDGLLYITTGDGWEMNDPGDPVQSLTTFTGKILRIAPNGSIPATNPFYAQTTGNFRAIYSLGLRNPFSMAKDPFTGALYVNDARGSQKDQVYSVAPGANYGHEGSSAIGTPQNPWGLGAAAGSELITGGAWYPLSGPFPANYHGAYFVALWGSNGDDRGQISYFASSANPTVLAFEQNVGLSTNPPVKPVKTRVGPDGNLYYLLTTYQTTQGTVQRVRFTGLPTVATPDFAPLGGNYVDPVQVVLSSTTPGAALHFTLDGSDPTSSSPLYTAPISISGATQIKVIGLLAGFNPSSIATASYTIGPPPPNIPPIVDAGPDKTVLVNSTTVLDGSGTTDPDGDDELLTGEMWTQLSGPPVTIVDATEEIAFFTPTVVGTYEFELEVSDGQDSDTDTVVITVIDQSGCAAGGALARYEFKDGAGTTVTDVSGVEPSLDLSIQSGVTQWLPSGGLALLNNAILTSNGPAAKLISNANAGGAFAAEVWIKPANVTQEGPARIATMSGSTTSRNFTIGQGKFGSTPPAVFDFRLRTTDGANNNNGEPSITTAPGVASLDLTHVLYSRNALGEANVYVDGLPVLGTTSPGELTNWDAGYSLTVGNEIGGCRAWLGEIYALTWFGCALDANDAASRFNGGPYPSVGSPPAASRQIPGLGILAQCLLAVSLGAFSFGAVARRRRH